ncbi:MAG: NAD(P)H-binding protein [Nitrospirae bacterium]|nr:NAD(P)H-binding protein [Nitrospirota bacterium]
MKASELNVVTGAFSFTGKYITERLLAMGKNVMTLTGHPKRPNPFGSRVSVFPFNFEKPKELIKNLEGAAILYNTYWVRFPHGSLTFEKAVEHTEILIKAAKEAGIKRIVHISITNADMDSPLPYFKGKGIIEKAIIDSKLSYAIIRPTVTFGIEDILINNIAWLLRKSPVFAIPGTGEYKLQPVFVEDLADIAIDASNKKENMIIDAAGPEIYTFEELVKLIIKKIHSKAVIIYLPPKAALSAAKVIGYMVKDILLTKDEIDGLMSNLLISKEKARGRAGISDWLEKNADIVGTMHASELERHYR